MSLSRNRAVSVLLVEDNKTDQLLTKKALESVMDLKDLHIVDDGLEALHYLRNEVGKDKVALPDLIFLDLNMPRLDGREVLAELKSDSVLKQIPVVILTTSDAHEDVVKAYEHYANSFITKPFTFREFEKALLTLGQYWGEVVTLPPRRLAPSRTSSPPGVSEGLKVLLVEDERADVLIVKGALTRSLPEAELTSVETVAEAEEQLAEAHFDVLLTDLTLPDASGLESVQKLRLREAQIPIIVLTGQEDETTGVEALRLGADDYLVKSEIKGRSLGRAIRYALDRRTIQDELVTAQRALFVERLSRGVAHNFNNLLTTIGFNAELLKEGGRLHEEDLARVEEIERVIARGGALTRQLLTLGKSQLVSVSRFDLNKTIAELRSTLADLAEPVLKVDFSEGEALMVQGDIAQTEQLFLNLVIEMKDVFPWGGRLEIIIHPREEDKLLWCDVVIEGPELLAERVEEAWLPYTARSGRPEFSLGTGLSSFHSYFDQVGGRTTWEYLSDTIIQFRFGFPPAEPQSDVPAKALERESERPHRILVVEDEPGIRSLNQRLLKRSGYEVVCAESYDEALKIWSDDKDFDLVFTDIHLGPGPDGVELGQRLKGEKPELGMVYGSGYSPRFMESGGELREGENFVSKPYTLARVLTVIERNLCSNDSSVST